MKETKPEVAIHKRGMNNCGDYGTGGGGTSTATFQWKRVTCAKCIAKGKKSIPKALR